MRFNLKFTCKKLMRDMCESAGFYLSPCPVVTLTHLIWTFHCAEICTIVTEDGVVMWTDRQVGSLSLI